MFLMNRKSLIGTLFICSLLLSSCGGGSTTLGGDVFGLNRQAPDEFLVIAKPPLTLPPNFILSPTAGEGLQIETDDDIEGTIFSKKEPDGLVSGTSLGNSESYVLQQTGASGTSDDIRKVIDVETSRLADESKTFVENFIGVGGTEFGDTIDPEAEYIRLQEEKTAE